MVIFLVGLVTMILMRTLRKDFARYQKEDELEDLVRKGSCLFSDGSHTPRKSKAERCIHALRLMKKSPPFFTFRHREKERDDERVVSRPRCRVVQERDLGDEYGWKQVHGDVFRPPQYLISFTALVGTGYQLVFVAFCVILFVIMGDLYTG